jgi:hypothetical protein
VEWQMKGMKWQKHVGYTIHRWERKINVLPKCKIKDMRDVCCENGTTGLGYIVLKFSIARIYVH